MLVDDTVAFITQFAASWKKVATTTGRNAAIDLVRADVDQAAAALETAIEAYAAVWSAYGAAIAISLTPDATEEEEE